MSTPSVQAPFRVRLYAFLDPGDGMHMGERLFNALLAMLIVSNVAVTILSTVPGVYEM